MSRVSLLAAMFAFVCVVCAEAQTKRSARAIVDAAAQKDSVQETMRYLKENAESAASPADRRYVLYHLGQIQEQMGLYDEASRSFSAAAGISASDAWNVPKVSSEQIVLDAVRTSLCAGNTEAADSYLRSSVSSSNDANIRACVNLYTQWSVLCKAGSTQETEGAISQLKSYLELPLMNRVKPAVLLTLWYLTDSAVYSTQLQREYPASAETAITKGAAQIMSVPFWYFVPRRIHGEVDTSIGMGNSGGSSGASAPASGQSAPKKQESTSTGKITRQQLGLFKSKTNADALIARLKEKGFSAWYHTETRASGTTYYIVVVNENAEGTMGLKLRDAGFECYPVVE
ncbi:MAG: SPOR domain-containing protein [Treponema sp.]|nr:SPOR domain-containing protein [Treponema sp.]